MRIKLLMVSALAWLCLASVADATTVTVTGDITRIGTGVGGEGLYVTIGGLTSGDAPFCSAGFLFMPTTAAQYKDTVAIVIAVRAQGAPITVYYDNQNCSSGNPAAFNLISVSY
jgi:hypothetical protein